MIRSVRVLKNVLTNYLRFFLAGVIGFVVTPVMVHLLGDGDYGLWVTVFSLTGYFGLFDQGIRPSLVRYVSRDHALGDRAGLERTMASALLLYGAVGVVTLIASAVLASNFTHWFQIEPHQVAEARVVVLLAGASLALGFPLGVFGATLSGLQRYDIANGIGILVGVLRALAFVAVLRLGWGLIGLAWASLAMNGLGHLLSWMAVRRLLPDVKLSVRAIDGPHLTLIGSYSGFAFVGALATSIAFQTDALVITAFLGAALVTPFALASGLVDNARSLVYSATWVLSPTASELETLGERDKLHALLIVGCKYSVLVCWPVLLGLIVFGENLIVTWVGPRYATTASFASVLSPHGPQASAAQILVLLSLPTLLSLPQSTASSLLYGISRHRGVVGLALINAALNLALSLWWVKTWGLAGVALGTAVPLALVGGIATQIYVCRALGLPAGRYTWEGVVQPGLVCLAFLVPAIIVERVWHPLGWLPLAAAIGGCWLPFAAAAWRFGITNPERERWGRMLPGLFDAGEATIGGTHP